MREIAYVHVCGDDGDGGVAVVAIVVVVNQACQKYTSVWNPSDSLEKHPSTVEKSNNNEHLFIEITTMTTQMYFLRIWYVDHQVLSYGPIHVSLFIIYYMNK